MELRCLMFRNSCINLPSKGLHIDEGRMRVMLPVQQAFTGYQLTNMGNC